LAPIALLQTGDQRFAMALDPRNIRIREPAPALFHVGLELFPMSLNVTPTHGGLHKQETLTCTSAIKANTATVNGLSRVAIVKVRASMGG
jgi:hypothetical protein